MGLFDKLKNVFFEEEYVEVEEEPIKKEKVTVAKRIETPEIKKAKEEAIKKELEERSPEVVETPKPVEKPVENEHRFPMDFDERDFEVEEKIQQVREVPPVVKEEPPVIQIVEEKVEEKVEYNNYYPTSNVNTYNNNTYHGLYEGSERREKNSGFKPSPIISPIYGVLDKNYKKEEIVTKKEIRLSASSSKKVDLDTVREKAYGDLASEITASIDEELNEEPEIKEEENLLYDLNEDDSPAVKVVTMGDAEEYFNDLGLEYNVDYKVEREKKVDEDNLVTRRSERNRIADLGDLEEKNNEEEKTESESNLFDLIEAMYEDKE